MAKQKPLILKQDPWLAPYESQLTFLHDYIKQKRSKVLGDQSIEDFALGFLHYGLHETDEEWIVREWAPNATKMYLICPGSQWMDEEEFRFIRRAHGNWELRLPKSALNEGDKFRLHIFWRGGNGFRIPSYARYVVQDEETKSFDAYVTSPRSSYEWQHQDYRLSDDPPLIYEAHVGMSSEEGKVSSYREFADDILPRVVDGGYNTIQLMAVAEHPYYGSFGYHVSNFFAASSRFGPTDDLKYLVDKAHGLGIRVIMDIVHSHSVKNTTEGLGNFAGEFSQYFYPGEKGYHTQWDSYCFDYGKPEVLHFLLSNCRFWLDEYNFDGFRFDGVTSMLYSHHGLGKAFTSYDDYFSEATEKDAIAYLAMANELIHKVKPGAITIAEDTSAMPGIAAPLEDGGFGFDYRLSMGVPDLWIKTLKEREDEDWDFGHLLYELTASRPEEKTISYAESHDQALVGDKTLIFRLMDQAMYWHMHKDDDNPEAARGVALHKMIRLITASTHNGGYLAFMGNEFGHPEWIDFPREGNDWSYDYARRQWSLADNPDLKYKWLGDFDKAMINTLKQVPVEPVSYTNVNQPDAVLSYVRGDFLFVYNFSPVQSYESYGVPVAEGSGEYKSILTSDAPEFGGYSRVEVGRDYPIVDGMVKLYLPARTATVLKRI